MKNVISISYFPLIFSIKARPSPWPAKFNAIYMQPHTSLRGFCRDTKSYQHPLVQICQVGFRVTLWREAFWGNEVRDLILVQFIECAPAVTLPGTTGHCCPLEARRTPFSRCCSFSLHSSRGNNKTSSGLLPSIFPSHVNLGRFLRCSNLLRLTPSSSSDPFRW